MLPFVRSILRLQLLTPKHLGGESVRFPSGRASELFILLVLLGCNALEPVASHEAITDPAQLYMALTLDHRAINLSTTAPYHTIQLTAIPRDALGEAMTGLPVAAFRSSDTVAVHVTAEGLIEALQPAQGVRVIAELTAEGNVRHADTAVINVTSDVAPPMLDMLSVDPVPPDSAIRSLAGPVSVAVLFGLAGVTGMDMPTPVSARAVATDGTAILGLVTDYRSLDPPVARMVDRNFGDGLGRWQLIRPGHVRIVASTTAYGVTKADTAVFTVTLPVVQGIRILDVQGGQPFFEFREVKVRPNGFVVWHSRTAQPVDVTFDDPTFIEEATPLCTGLASFPGATARFCGGGNIAAFTRGSATAPLLTSTRARRFPRAGVYTYRSTVTGATGRIVVTDNL